jgi:amino acid adenylation domain-containing protein
MDILKGVDTNSSAETGRGTVHEGRSDYPRNSCIHELFQTEAAKRPDSIALSFGSKKLSYRTLNERANRLANHLIALGVGRESLVSICLERSDSMVVGLLAILKAGGAYVPLEPNYPADRLDFMLRDTAAPVLISERSLLSKLPEDRPPVVLIDEIETLLSAENSDNPCIAVRPGDLAYVMYTSGSTGRPKGVMIEHRSVVRLVKNTNYANFGPSEVFLQLAPISFDASTFEIWGPLLNGGSLAIMPQETFSLEDLGNAIKSFRVSTLFLTTALFNLTLDQRCEALWPIRQLIAGGDFASPSHFRKALEQLPNSRIIHAYGPTESTTFALCHRVGREDCAGRLVPIGFPISNTSIVLLDSKLAPVSDGEVGELFIGGEGLARGYLNQPELTAAKFIEVSIRSESPRRLYRTGDLARYRHDGALEFLGRVDDQVKISGFRIEPDEIAFVLRQHDSVNDAVVVARAQSHGEKRLVAYVVPVQGAVTAGAELRAFLSRKLPPHMVPSALVTLSSLPLTPNGKIDHAALPDPNLNSTKTGAERPTPQNAIEEAITAIWLKVLQVGQVGLQDNFFDLGGNSLQLIEVHVELQKRFGQQLPIADLFEHPNIASLALRFASLPGNPPTMSEVESRARKQREALSRRKAARAGGAPS